MLQILKENWLFLLIIAGLAVGWLLLRTRGTSISVDGFDQQINSGQPVVVEFYSNT